MPRTEFYETAVKYGFYGVDKSVFFGKKDYVRKYWEDILIKISVRPALEQILERKNKIRIADLGCGSGEGIILLTHIPPGTPPKTAHKEFIITKDDIKIYQGIDVSSAMVEEGQKNYAALSQIKFVQADLSEGFPLLDDSPYDIYFSSYGSLSHLTSRELEELTRQIFSHISDCGYMVFDLHGRYSPEWPKYWDKDCSLPLPYNMAYLLPPERQNHENIEWFDVTYWNSQELIQLIEQAAASAKRNVEIITLRDRSIFVGRHMDTSLFKKQKHQIRGTLNRLFDYDHRGDIGNLNLNIDYLEEVKNVNHQAWTRISTYRDHWQIVINILQSLTHGKDSEVKKIIESSPETIVDELKMLAWLYRNADRFPVVDFWASIMGPQVACVLRNLELSLPQGLGCGHGLLCVVKIENK